MVQAEAFDAIEGGRASLAVAQDPTAAAIFVGDLLRARREYTEAASLYERALSVRIDAVDAIYGAAASYVALGRVAEAVHPLQRAARVDPSRVDVHRLLASSLVAVGQKQEALAAFATRFGGDAKAVCAEIRRRAALLLELSESSVSGDEVERAIARYEAQQ